MATAVQQATPNQGPNPGPSTGPLTGQSPNTNVNGPQDPSSSDVDSQLWDGDKMFNIYIWDYCQKRGYLGTAQKLVEEAKLPPTPRPPIDAKQGLLYEWWSVFWVLFSAKNSGSGSEDAMVVVQHHLSRVQNASHPQGPPGMRFPQNAAIGGRPGMGPMQPPNVPGTAPPQGQGMPPAGPAGTQLAGPSTQPMPNGIGPAPPPPGAALGAPGPQQPSGMPPPQNAPLGFPSHPQHPIPGQPNGVMPGTPTGPVHPGQPGIAMVSRPPMNIPGMAPGMVGRPPFNSPTIQHASGSVPSQPGQPGQPGQMPQQQPGQPGQQQPHHGQPSGPQYPVPPMSHLSGHYPSHMRPMGMLPPGQNPMTPGNPAAGPNAPGANGSAGGPTAAASPSHTQSGSRAPTPAMPYGSPSMAHRANPQNGPQQGQGPQPGGQPQQTPPGFGAPPSVPQGQDRPPFDQVAVELSKINPQTVQELKRELGLGNKEVNQLNLEEKRRIIQQYHQRSAGPSSQGGIPRSQQQQQQQGQMQRGKRSSVSPGDEPTNETQIKGEASPPDKKRMRTSPEQNGPQGPPNAHGPPPTGGPMPGTFPAPVMQNGMRPGQYTPQMAHMSPNIMAQNQGQMMTPMPQQMTQQLKSHQYHSAMQQIHMRGADPTSFNPTIDAHRSAPPAFAPNGVVTPNSMSNIVSRPPMQQNKPGQMMPPPSSPATNGKPGQPPGPLGKPDGQVGMVVPKTENSPRTQASAPPSSAGGAGPTTPALGQAQTSNASAPSPSQQSSNTPRPPTAAATPSQVPSGSATPAVQSGMPPQPQSAPVSMPSLDDFNFNSFDDLSSIFGTTTGNNGAVDFEQDFSEWFNSNDLSLLESTK